MDAAGKIGRFGTRNSDREWLRGATPEFIAMLNLAETLIERGRAIGFARIVPRGVDAAAVAELRRIARTTSECLAWGCCDGLGGVMFRADLLYELMPIWRKVLDKYPRLQVGVALSGVVGDSEALWLATRIALADAISQGRQMVVLDARAAAERVVPAGQPRLAVARGAAAFADRLLSGLAARQGLQAA